MLLLKYQNDIVLLHTASMLSVHDLSTVALALLGKKIVLNKHYVLFYFFLLFAGVVLPQGLFFVAVAQSVYFVVCVVVFVKHGRLPLPSHLRTGPQRERLCCLCKTSTTVYSGC